MNLFGENEVLTKLSNLGDPLEKLNQVINWEIFRQPLTDVFNSNQKGIGGRKPYDYVMMFKILVLQRFYNISDDKTEYMILDRYSFRRFIGLDEFTKSVPDAKTIWKFKNDLAQADTGRVLFETFYAQLESAGLISHEGTLVDASFVEVPKQRNKRDENAKIKNGETPDEWSANKKSQKDVDARWTKKNNINYYGYKIHDSVDCKSKFVKNYKVTSANVHDGQIYDVLLSDKDQVVYADSAYIGQELNNPKIKQQVIERATRKHPLTDEQKEHNRAKSKTRCRVEHVFGFIKNSMNGSYFRGIGAKRAEFHGAFTNLVYNLFRFEQVERLALLPRG